MDAGNAFKLVGMGLPIATLVTVMYGFFTETWHDVFIYVIGLVILTLFFSLILPRFLPRAETWAIRDGIHSTGERINLIVVGLALVLVYVIGVGIVFLSTRIIGKRFMDLHPNHSSWRKCSSVIRDEEMF